MMIMYDAYGQRAPPLAHQYMCAYCMHLVADGRFAEPPGAVGAARMSHPRTELGQRNGGPQALKGNARSERIFYSHRIFYSSYLRAPFLTTSHSLLYLLSFIIYH